MHAWLAVCFISCQKYAISLQQICGGNYGQLHHIWINTKSYVVFDVVRRKIRHHNGTLPWLFSMIMVWKWKFKKFWKSYQKTECTAWSIYVRWENSCFTIWLISNMFASVTERYRNLVPNFGLWPNSRQRMTGVWTLKDEMYKTVDELRHDLQL